MPCILKSEDSSKDYRENRARLIQKVYKVDPLTCPECEGKMKIISVLDASPVACLVIVSNQFTLVRVLGNGERGLESKAVADWYQRANVKPGEGIVCAMTCTVQLHGPGKKEGVAHFYNGRASSPSEFVSRDCRIVIASVERREGQRIGFFGAGKRPIHALSHLGVST